MRRTRDETSKRGQAVVLAREDSYHFARPTVAALPFPELSVRPGAHHSKRRTGFTWKALKMSAELGSPSPFRVRPRSPEEWRSSKQTGCDLP